MNNTQKRFFTNEKEKAEFYGAYEKSKAVLMAAIQAQFEKDYPKDETMNMVEEFHRVFQIPDSIDQPPQIPTTDLSLLRIQCLVEEVGELAHALAKGDLVEVLDALCDIQYFVDGAFLICGLQRLKLAGMREVHRSNMTKLDDNGQPIKDASGRVVKSSNYSKPNLKGVLDEYLCRTQSKHLKEQKRQLFGLLYGANYPCTALVTKEYRPIQADQKKAEPVITDHGPDYPDGLDSEGFPGGNKRFQQHMGEVLEMCNRTAREALHETMEELAKEEEDLQAGC